MDMNQINNLLEKITQNYEIPIAVVDPIITNSKKNYKATAQQQHDDDDEDSDPTTAKFRNLVKNLLRLEDEMEELNAQIKPRREQKNQLRSEITRFMIENDLESLNLPDGSVFSLIKSEKKVNPLTKKRLPESISKYFSQIEKLNPNDASKKVETILKFVWDNAEKKTASSLRRKK